MKKIRFFSFNINFLIGLVLSIIGTFITLTIPLVLKKLIDLKSMVNHLDIKLLLEVFIFLIISTIMTALSEFLISKFGDELVTKIRLDVQTHLINLPLKFFENKISGQLTSRVVNDTVIIKMFMIRQVPNAILAIITIIGVFIILFTLNWKLALMILVAFPLILLISVPLGKINKNLAIQTQKNLSKLAGLSTEGNRNIRAIKLNNAQNNFIKHFKSYVMNLYKISIKQDKIYAITVPLQGTFTLIIILGIVLYGGIMVQEHVISAGTLVSFLIYLFQLIPAVNDIAALYTQYKQVQGATTEINNILNQKIENYDQFSTHINKYQHNESNDLSLKNVKFAYNKKDILNNINMNFNSKEKVAIVGPSGVGKTTIINLITRLYPVKEGKIIINNTNANKFNLKQWRKMFGVVTQDNTIISGTLYDNLVFGLDYKPSNDEITQALKISNLNKECNELPQGIYTIIGEQGMNLSGGQRQRLQIARAYLKDPQFLILDEATSNLDSDSEHQVAQALDKVMKNKTIIAIAHRLSTIVDANKIYFLDKQGILGSGTHKELMQKLPEYRKFVEEQFLDID